MDSAVPFRLRGAPKRRYGATAAGRILFGDDAPGTLCRANFQRPCWDGEARADARNRNRLTQAAPEACERDGCEARRAGIFVVRPSRNSKSSVRSDIVGTLEFKL